MAEPDVLVVVQCRFGSTRLPGKALLPLAGTTMLGFLLRRLSAGLDPAWFRLVTATTLRGDDDQVAAEAARHGVAVVRGETDDLVARFVRCLQAYPASVVVRVTADNPLTSPRSITEMVDLMRCLKADYARCQGFPLGASADALTAEALRRMHGLALSGAQREHINKHVLDNPGEYAVAELVAQGAEARPELSMTVDTPEDYARMAGLFGPEDTNPWNMELHEAARRMAG